MYMPTYISSQKLVSMPPALLDQWTCNPDIAPFQSTVGQSSLGYWYLVRIHLWIFI